MPWNFHSFNNFFRIKDFRIHDLFPLENGSPAQMNVFFGVHRVSACFLSRMGGRFSIGLTGEINPLIPSAQEKAWVRELLQGRTWVSARIIEWMECLFHQLVRMHRMNLSWFFWYVRWTMLLLLGSCIPSEIFLIQPFHILGHLFPKSP